MSSFSPAGLARACARRPWITVGVWVVLMVLAAVSAPALGDALTTEADFLNNPESIHGQKLLEERLRGPEPVTETVIVRSPETTVDDPAFRAAVERVTASLAGMPQAIASVTNVYQTGAPSMVSADRRSTIIPVTFVGGIDDAGDHAKDYLETIKAGNSDPAFQVMTVGTVSLNEEFATISEEDLTKGEGIGIPVALIILVVVFGAIVAAFLPLVLALVSIFVAIGIIAVIGRSFELSFFITNIVTMIGLAVGIDYALFVVERYREERRRGHEKLDAITVAGATASRAVVFSGLTVMFALAGLFLVPTSIYRSLSLGAVVVVAVAVAATLTLVPAMLSILGDRINWPRRRRYDATAVAAQEAHDRETIHRGFWGRVTRLVMGHPWISVTVSAGLLILFTLPYFSINEGLSGISDLPDTDAKAAFTVLSQEFSAGLVSPVEVVVDGSASDPRVQSAVAGFTAALAQDPTYGPVTVQSNPAGDLTLVSFPLNVQPDSVAGYDAVERLRGQVVPAAFAGAPAQVFVSGQTAVAVDLSRVTNDYTPIVFAFVLGLTLLLLMVAFRSIVVPLKAIIMNLLSVGAAYGLLVAVFQKGWGAGLFGFKQVDTIEAWLPLFLFSILFGLSMDYHVFLLSRIREHYSQTHNNAESVAVGLQATAKIITGAALIMVVVFSGFAAGRLVSLQQTGFGLAVAVLLDATVVRSVLVPASMALLGDRNWYLPSWLNWLPDLRIEGTSALPPVAAPVARVEAASAD